MEQQKYQLLWDFQQLSAQEPAQASHAHPPSQRFLGSTKDGRILVQ